MNKDIRKLEDEISYLYDKFTRASHRRSGTILKELTRKRKELAAIKNLRKYAED